MFHSLAFDFSVWEIWGALTTGGRVVVVPTLVSRDTGAFYGLVRDAGVTMLSQTPSAFRQFEAADAREGPAWRCGRCSSAARRSIRPPCAAGRPGAATRIRA